MPNATDLKRHLAESASATGRRLYSVAEARARLGGLGRTYMWELIRRGDLPVVRIGRRVLIADDDFEAFIDERRQSRVRPLLEIIRLIAARLAWIREEAEPSTRERALEDLELDVAGWLADHDEGEPAA